MKKIEFLKNCWSLEKGERFKTKEKGYVIDFNPNFVVARDDWGKYIITDLESGSAVTHYKVTSYKGAILLFEYDYYNNGLKEKIDNFKKTDTYKKTVKNFELAPLRVE